MMDSKNIKRMPKLRFHEFDSNWEVSKLEDVTKKIQDGTHFSPNTCVTGNYKYITSRNIRNGSMDISDVNFLSHEEHCEI